MSLFEPADGILETHVTWEDIETDLQKKLGTKATFGDNKKATNISDLKGFMSRIALVEPDWQNVEEGKELPNKFALKISSQLALVAVSKIMNFEDGKGFSDEKMNKLSKLTRDCHNREVETYKILSKFNHPDVPYTKVYSLKSFEEENDLKGYMIIDFVSNVHHVPVFRTIPADELIPLVRGIATFSAFAQSLSLTETSFVMGKDYLEILFKDFFNDTELNKKFEGLRKQFSEENQEKVGKVIETFHHYKTLVPKYTNISDILGLKLVLNHGDLWQANVIHSMGEDGKLKLEAMIDWQGVSRMPPGLDLSRLLLMCLSGKDRRQKGNEIIKCYYETFTKVYGKELLSLQELQDSYKLYAPMTAMMLLPDINSFIESSGVSEEEKDEARKESKKNMVAMMEDILDIHE
ncbi:hypothetical protein GCK72_019296 [Caenorhabditis remanei]|uniref:CHK kinase-like domain-containing protein n=1 Tax=Caenorhabditis remanei TaxID=31234 RepID=A0A6A5GDE3_CAERE|nr:hypothetical protein GCK72_019296 [Caenorhabditis remanei]KAF1752741.1 hypothetical protein GCK72_019296 [Caenorhabditis remanei]